MDTWNAGYVADIGYTYGYYNELNPLRIKLAFLNAGMAAPALGHACELGYGQGVSVNMHAAASQTSWHGTDFNPAQAGFAQDLASASGAGARLVDDDFKAFCSRADLPDFDTISLHGIWSWISDDNRHTIVDFVRRKLKVGGVLYISYNTMPGWAQFAPLRNLMTQHAEVLACSGHGVVSRIDGAIEFAEKLVATKPGFIQANPLVAERLKQIKGQNRSYLAHEYFNRDWHPMHFASMAEWLAPAKLSYACSANYLDNVDALNLTPEQQALLNGLPDATFRESTRDFMTNQQFRRDYWVRGARQLSALEKSEALRAHQVVLVAHRPDVKLEATGALGMANLQEAVYAPVLDLLADHKPRTLGQIEQAIISFDMNMAKLVQAVTVLTGIGHLVAVQDEATTAKVKKQCDKLNQRLANKARSDGEVGYRASPVIGGGIPVSRFDQLFLMALSHGKKQPAEWAQFVWQILAAQSQQIVKDGKALATPEDNLAELTTQALEFAQKRLPILKALQAT